MCLSDKAWLRKLLDAPLERSLGGFSLPMELKWHRFKAVGNKVVPAYLEGWSVI